MDRQSNTTDLLAQLAQRSPWTPLYAVRSDDGWTDVTAGAFEDQVKVLARGLIASGLKPSDPVAVFSPTSYAWTLVDFAIWYAGGVTVPIYETSAPAQIAWILQDSGARHVFVADRGRRRAVQTAAEEAGTSPSIWLMSDEGYGPDFSDLRLLGEPVADSLLEAHRSSNTLDTPASLVYTSGTTGQPRGCIITHGNFTVLARNTIPVLQEVIGENGRTLMFLPLAHVLARAVQVMCLVGRVQIGHVGNTGTLMRDVETFAPTFLLGVPRIFEKIFAATQRRAENTGLGKPFAAAVRTAVRWSELEQERAWYRGPAAAAPRIPLRLRAAHTVFDALFYSRLRSTLGGSLAWAICGASALDPHLTHFFRGAGIPVLEGYGLTETTAPAAVNVPSSTKVGTVGIPLPGTTVRIADDGEVLIRGVGVFAGYHGAHADGEHRIAADAVAAPLPADGFLHTGDVGRIDDDGFLSITGRLKDLIVTAGGKNVAPGPLEEALRREPLVDQAVVVGDGRPYVAALLTLDEEELAAFAVRHRLGPLTLAEAAEHPQVRDHLQHAVDAANAPVSRAESIRRFAVLPTALSLESGHLSESLKVKRHVVTQDFADAVDGLYTAAGTTAG
ncbi:long-chain-fatty-acid--CoA ligase [Tersicoccus solisilvae]|uniref:Acyl-CoA synthetase n=1 Tax=Tersicoccus solisilvae TaxID=1882339 RepID=A0ABQ1P974_9MICC|nr:long-chain-fatty-acid--CoA ligase [Tersicoccus solisilvae]